MLIVYGCCAFCTAAQNSDLNTNLNGISASMITLSNLINYFSYVIFDTRSFLSTIDAPLAVIFNTVAYQWKGNINISPGTYTANQTIVGQEGIFVRLFALDGANLQKLFPTIDNYSVGETLCSENFLYTQGSSYSISVTSVRIVKVSNTQSYVCVDLLKGTSASPSMTVNSPISIKTGAMGMMFKPVIRFT